MNKPTKCAECSRAMCCGVARPGSAGDGVCCHCYDLHVRNPRDPRQSWRGPCEGNPTRAALNAKAASLDFRGIDPAQPTTDRNNMNDQDTERHEREATIREAHTLNLIPGLNQLINAARDKASKLPNSRVASLVATKLDEAHLWASEL